MESKRFLLLFCCFRFFCCFCLLSTLYFLLSSLLLRSYAVYVLAVMLPPVPVQLVWKNWPRGLSTRS